MTQPLVPVVPVVQWTTASPLWPDAAGAAFRRPALLRLAGDAFMEDLLSLLRAEPARLAGLRARPETWQGPAEAQAPVAAVTPLTRNGNLFRRARERAVRLAERQAGTSGVIAE